MSGWTHALCAQCWAEENGGRIPVVMRNAEAEVCCRCGANTRSGIYIRRDPVLLSWCNHKDGT